MKEAKHTEKNIISVGIYDVDDVPRVRRGHHSEYPEPSPVGKKALSLIAQWRAENSAEFICPEAIQVEAWDIARNPTETIQLLSRTHKPIGITVNVPRTPSFLKKD